MSVFDNDDKQQKYRKMEIHVYTRCTEKKN